MTPRPAPDARAAVVVRAPAKINLRLEVLRRRRDGYHEVRTLLQAVSLFDRVTLRRRPRGIALSCPGLDVPARENLAWRAAALFLERTGVRGGLAVALEKRIPAGAGLGGGSSDAAAVLLGACRLFGLRPPEEELRSWAAGLGSDVPFFIGGGTALAMGRGEEIRPLPTPADTPAALVVYPGFSLATARVYARWRPRLTRPGRARTIQSEDRRGKKGAAGSVKLRNDLEEAAFGLVPELAALKARLYDLGATGALLSGSGSALFGLFSGPGPARRAAGTLRRERPGLVRTVRFLPPRRRWGVVKR